MNKKKMERVKSLYRDGVSMDVCFSSIMGMSSSDTEAAVFIRKFVREMIEQPLREEIAKLHKDAFMLQNKGNDLTQEEMDEYLLIEEDKKDEPRD
jgi:hypothetical protein